MKLEWTKAEENGHQIWRSPAGRDRGYVTKYIDGTGFNWQGIRGQERLSAIVGTLDEAMACAEAALALPEEEFIEKIVTDLLEELRQLEQRIQRLKPAAKTPPGYQNGFNDGLKEAHKRILTALEIAQ